MKQIVSLLLFFTSLCHAQVTFEQAYAPHDGLVKSPEANFRQEICLNGLWDFQGMAWPQDWKRNTGQAPPLPAPAKNGWDDVKIKIPSPWNVNAYMRSDGPDHHDFPSYPKAWESFQMGWLRKQVTIPADWQGQRILLHFEAVAGTTEVFVNDHKVCENSDIFLPFEADITDYAQAGDTLEIKVGVRKTSLFDDTRTIGRRTVPGGSMWGQFIVGIWQDVFLVAVPRVRIQEAYVKPLVSQDLLELDVTLQNDSTQSTTVSIGGTIKEWQTLAGHTTISAPQVKWQLGQTALTVPAHDVVIPAASTTKVTLSLPTQGQLKLWSPETPNLYGLILSLHSHNQPIDAKYQRFGWRQWSIERDQYLLNGTPIELHGDSWHFQGIPQLTRRYAWAWFTALKEANCNAVRPHAQVYPSFYLDMADEMGICVLDETAIWASDGGHKFDSETFWSACNDHVKRLVLRDRNHASVFGWSISNENRAIITNVIHRPDLLPRQIQAWTTWRDICLSNDPTRLWISGDGEEDGDGTLPIVMGHYGDEGSMNNWRSHGKPWGVGEHSMAYYGTPKQVSKYNGARAYESQLGRMEGLAYECYDLIALQRRLGASYVSVFNMAWYALQPLALGLADVTQPVTSNSGIFFTAPYVEGKPGVQPERLGPYCTTFNPGYDPTLPLYKPWPMFEAIKQANAPAGPAQCHWADMPKPVDKVKATVTPKYSSVLFMGQGVSSLKAHLAARGVPFDLSPKDESTCLVIVDGQYTLTQDDMSQLNHLLSQGSDVWVWGLVPQTAKTFNDWLMFPVVVTDRKATSLLIYQDAPIVAGLDHADFYFSEIQRTPAMEHGLTGAFVEQGQIILKACDTDWTRWNKVEESVKTAAVLRSERQAKPGGAAMVQCAMGKGQVMINTMTSFYNTEPGTKLLRTLLTNAGVPLKTVDIAAGQGVFDLDGNLSRALVCGSFEADSMQAAFDTDFLDQTATANPKAHTQANGKTWVVAQTVPEGHFNLKAIGLKGPVDNVAAYMSFWLWSPRPLDDLLIEPDMPRLDLVAGADDSCRIWLNGQVIQEDFAVHPLRLGDIECKNLPVKQGWNHFLIKVVQGGGEWSFAAQLRCSKFEFLTQLKASLENPDQ